MKLVASTKYLYSAKVFWKYDLLWSNSIFWFFLVSSLTGRCALLSQYYREDSFIAWFSSLDC